MLTFYNNFFLSATYSAVFHEPTPRSPIKAAKRRLEPRPPAAAVNGSRDVESGSEDEGGMLQLTVYACLQQQSSSNVFL